MVTVFVFCPDGSFAHRVGFASLALARAYVALVASYGDTAVIR